MGPNCAEIILFLIIYLPNFLRFNIMNYNKNYHNSAHLWSCVLHGLTKIEICETKCLQTTTEQELFLTVASATGSSFVRDACEVGCAELLCVVRDRGTRQGEEDEVQTAGILFADTGRHAGHVLITKLHEGQEEASYKNCK